MGNWKTTALAAALLATQAAHIAHAQTAPRVAVGGNPLEALPQVNAPAKPPAVEVEVKAPQQQLQDLLARHITPKTIEVQGVKSLKFEEVAKRFTPFVGRDITIGQLVETANGVTALYKERGYALSFAFVPAQDFADGVVRVTVVEGYVKDIKIKGEPGNLEKRIRAIAQRIAADRPLRQETFERYVNVLGMIPGAKIDATVAPPQNTDGATTLELNVTRKRFNLSSGINANQPGLSGIFSATENGNLGLGESLSASFLAPPGRNDTTYYGVNAMVPVGSDGFAFKLDATHYYGHPKDNPGLPSSIERTVVNDKLALSAIYPFILTNARSLLATATVYATHDEDRLKNMEIASNPQLTQRSQIRVAQIALDYTSIAANVVRRANINVAKAMNIFGASKTAETNIEGLALTNPVSLTFFRSGATVSQTNEWPFKISTVVSATGQYSPDTLPTSEQISFGAGRYAAGYQPGEVSGDSGWGASFEVNRPLPLDWTFLKSVTPYASIDTARVFLHGGTPNPKRLASVALGFRISDVKHYSIDLSLARAIGDAPVESASRAPRVNATFSYQLN
jgi:hemolysin activation/secretion protein